MNGLAIVSAYLGARWRAATLHGDRLAAWQHARATALADVVRRRSAFYHAHWGDAPSSAWSAFPTVAKPQMMDAFDAFNTVGVTRDEAMRVALAAERSRDFSATLGGLTVGLSSGTSGHRGLFLVSADEQTRWAGTILARAIPDLRPGHRVAFFLRANSRLYERTSSVVRFAFFDLFDPLDVVLPRLEALQPQLIVGPPSLLGMLADARASGALRCAPQRLISVAEVLEPQERARLEGAFQVPVGEVYQCTEGLVAVSCAAGSLHVQEDVMVVQHTPVTPDDPTRVSPILTDLWRHTQPIIRYALNDVLRLDPAPCACGSTWQRIAAIEGRQDDLCWFPRHDDTLRPIFPDAVRRMILLADDRIEEYHAEQPAPGVLHVHLSVGAAAPFSTVAARVRETIAAHLSDAGCTLVALTIDEGRVPVAPGAKRRRVVNTWRISTPGASRIPVPS